MSSESWKVSGQKFKFPQAAPVQIEKRPGGWVILTTQDGSRHRMMMSEFRGLLSASLHGQVFHGSVQSERSHGARADAGGGESDLTSQFPGKVRKVLVSEGVTVSEGDALVLVEAMKMEFTIKAPCAGIVKRILVKEGQQISPGDRFLDFAEKRESSEGSQ